MYVGNVFLISSILLSGIIGLKLELNHFNKKKQDQ
jgi:hypothetical protein